MIRADIRLPLGSFSLGVELRLEAPVTALFGISGAGKTSVLEVLAGLRGEGLEGEIEIDGQTVFSSRKKKSLEPERRGIGYVPQDVLLFPHMSVMQNILYGSGGEAESEGLEQVLDILEIRHLTGRRPAALSGGECQRVALARALMARPRLLLLDEPMAALHAGLKNRIFPYLKRIHSAFGVPMIYVSHDAGDVRAFCDEVVALDQGMVVSQGAPDMVFKNLKLS